MSEVEKLSILGIRSFDNTRSETIRFHTPLTLIVGENGSGKTTIIECLKYATTGELPPNSKGGAFIHDPKICREKEVLAQVKLLFKATTGARMVATRSLQLTVKKTTRQQKTLEGNLLMMKDGERASISSRVAELDQILPQYLGVSKAILESVIFCHQDDSLWPMSEPSVLKKKFDDIFEASKYTKAIDNIKVLRKKQNEELAKYKINEQHAKENKDKAEKAEKRSVALSKEIETLRHECEDLSRQMEQAAAAASKAWTESESYATIIGELKGKRVAQKGIEANIESLREHLVEVEEPDEWLQTTLAEFQSRQDEYQRKANTLKERYLDLDQQTGRKNGELGTKQKECGKHENDKARYHEQVSRREALVRKIARENNMRDYDTELDGAKFTEFMSILSKLCREREEAFEKAKEESKAELREVQTSLNQLEQRRSALQEQKNSARRQMSHNNSEAESYQNALDEIDIDEGRTAVLESRVAEVQRSLEKAKETASNASWTVDIDQKNVELRAQEETSSRLNLELIEGTKHAGELARLDHLKKELKDRERSLETMLGAHEERIKKFLGNGWEPSTLEKTFQSQFDQAAQKLASAERDRDEDNRSLDHVNFRLRSARDKLQKNQKDAKEAAEKIREAISDEPSEYDAVLEAREKALSEVKDEAGLYLGRQKYWETCIETAEKKNVCRTCTRPFEKDEKQKTISRLRGLIEKTVYQQVEEYEDDVKAARDVSSDHDTWVRLTKNEIPGQQKETRQLEGERKDLLAKIEEQDSKVADLMQTKRDLESLTRTVTSIAKYDSEVVTLKSQIEELSERQKEGGSRRTLEDIQEEIMQSRNIIQDLQKQVSRLNEERERSRNEITRLELNLRDVRSEYSNAQYQLERKASLVARIEEYRALNAKQHESIDKADKDMKSISPEIAKAQAKYEDISSRAEAREKELQQKVSQLSEAINKIAAASDDINAYIRNGGEQQLEQARQELEEIATQIAALKEQQGAVSRELNGVNAQIQDAEITKHKYSENLRYREELRKLQKVNEEIEDLESKDAEVDRSRFVKESEKWTKRHNALSAMQASKMGEMKSKDDQLLELLADWETDYKDAGERYKEAHIKVAITKAAVEDLGKYGGALDKAIMKYHSLKMEEINSIVEELWQKTYKGTDVDTILIRSDNETARGNRSYNYRVCMVKGDAEMDMRGRCSAGQKVLASIIIRLALAECFGVNCGLIALDEPTTNLDANNIRSLAESLHDIIRERQQQANFQLIVITHDEDFLRAMKCGDFCDYYYRVSRDERQKSIIERQSIVEVM